MVNKSLNVKKPELLAPAGSIEAFFAAIDNGADAVYLGLKDFSARARAENFTFDDLKKLIPYAHSKEKKVYLALNTLIKESEISDIIELLIKLEEVAPDALIICDIGLWYIINKFFPLFKIHASTQMGNYSSYGFAQLKEMGFKRAVLERYTSLTELKEIVKKSQIEVEIFVHGALCFSFSGRCFFSSFLGGKSGNRGRCVQPCRRKYNFKGNFATLFSSRDLSAISMLPEIVSSGVASLKIEGRLKGADYVGNVVKGYRTALNSYPDNISEGLKEAENILLKAIGRPSTNLFISKGNFNEVVELSDTGNIGIFLGEIKKVKDNMITFTTNAPISKGERLRVQFRRGERGEGFTLKRIEKNGVIKNYANEMDEVTVKIPFKAFAGDLLFKVSENKEREKESLEAIKRFEELKQEKLLLDVDFSLIEEQVKITGKCGVYTFIIEETDEIQPLKGKTPLFEVVKVIFSQLGEVNFTLNSFKYHGNNQVFIPPSKLKSLKRKLLDGITSLIANSMNEKKEAVLNHFKAKPTLKPIKIRENKKIYLLSDNKTYGQHDFSILPFKSLSKLNSEFIYALPPAIKEDEIERYANETLAAVKNKVKKWLVSTFGQLYLCKKVGLPDIEIISNFNLHCLNYPAFLALKELGILKVIVSVENDFNNLKELFSHPDVQKDGILTVYGKIPLMITRAKVPLKESEMTFSSPKNELFSFKYEDGFTYVYPDKPFNLTGEERRLKELGINNYLFLNGDSRIISDFKKSRTIKKGLGFCYSVGLE